LCPSKGFAEKYQLRRHIQTHREKLDRAAAVKESKAESQEVEQLWTWSDDNFDDEIPEMIPEVEVKIEEKHETKEILVKEEDEESEETFGETDDQPVPTDDFIVKRMFKCKTCSELFDDLPTFDLHFSTHKPPNESNKSTTCKFCNKTFAKFQFLKIHIQAIHEKNLFECEICGKKFSFERAKVRHVEVVHNNLRKYKCGECGKDFGTSTQLKEHVGYYHSTKPLNKRTHYCEIDWVLG
jgi:DNA-directed RNA polymerase subunit RPC12/RpoP